MHDTFLFKRISDKLFEMCRENEIKKITYIEVDVNYRSHVNKRSLYDHLLEEIPELVDLDTVVKVNKNNTENLIAVIKKIEGLE